MNKKYKLDENYFENIDTEDKAYWLGFLLGDGCVVNFSLRLYLKDTVENTGHLEKFLSSLSANYKMYRRDNNGHPLVGVSINSKKFVENLIKQGIVPRKSYKAIFPVIDEEFNCHFIRGLFDADGCISGGRISFVGTKELMEQLQYLFERLDIKSKLRKAGKSKETFELYADRKFSLRLFYEYVYQGSNIFLQSKYFKLCERIFAKQECDGMDRNRDGYFKSE